MSDLSDKARLENVMEYIKILPIRQAYGFRNILAHNYGSVNINTVKDTIEKNIPNLKNIILSILKS